jgi:hypothetical protein
VETQHFNNWSSKRWCNKTLKYKNGGQVSDSVGLLISILVRFPEVGTINLDQNDQLLKFTFLLSEAEEEFTNYHQCLSDSITLFNQLEGRTCRVCNLSFHEDEGIVTLELRRDVETVTQNEINLVIDLLRQQFGEALVTDQGEEIPEEELEMQDEIIKHMLENIKRSNVDKNVIAVREDGRVLVFNK